MKSIHEKILEWVALGNTGVSSKAMAFCAAGIENECAFGNHAPSDPSDFNRCLMLVHMVPEVRDSFDKISKLTSQWQGVIENWDLIEKTFVGEVGFDWCNGRSAPKTYKLMHDIQDKAKKS